MKPKSIAFPAADMSIQTVKRRRDTLHSQDNCEFVEAKTFRQLLISRHRLVRSDDPVANIMGLLDPRSGKRFFIEIERLFPPSSASG